MSLLWHTESKSVTVTLVTQDTKDIKCGTSLQTRIQYDSFIKDRHPSPDCLALRARLMDTPFIL